MNEQEFKKAMIRHFGTQCEGNIDEAYDRVCKTLTSLLYCGTGNNSLIQDNPFLVLNVAFLNFQK